MVRYPTLRLVVESYKLAWLAGSLDHTCRVLGLSNKAFAFLLVGSRRTLLAHDVNSTNIQFSLPLIAHISRERDTDGWQLAQQNQIKIGNDKRRSVLLRHNFELLAST